MCMQGVYAEPSFSLLSLGFWYQWKTRVGIPVRRQGRKANFFFVFTITGGHPTASNFSRPFLSFSEV